jgi:hypothetical protein
MKRGFSFWGTLHGHYACKNPSQTITCVVGPLEALSTQQGSVAIEGLRNIHTTNIPTHVLLNLGASNNRAGTDVQEFTTHLPSRRICNAW